VAAIQSLGELLLKEEVYGWSELEEEAAMALVLMLVVHDVCTPSSLLVYMFG
jgi:hypothetical protein